MNGPPFLVPALINKVHFPRTLADTGCLSYGIIDSQYVCNHSLERIPINPISVTGYDGDTQKEISEVAIVRLDINGHIEERVFLYIVPQIDSYDMILGIPWMQKNKVLLSGDKHTLMLGATGTLVHSNKEAIGDARKAYPISAAAFTATVRQYRKENRQVHVFAASLADIEKALRPKTYKDPTPLLPPQYHDFLQLFDPIESQKLPPLRGKGIDHAIELVQEDGRDKEVPWGPLYNMSKDELLVLRKTLTDHLDKGFIRVSHSAAAAPVLFVRKPGGGLRFCVDYRALNAITKKDRYPLPLIHETLRTIGQAQWFTKLDVSAAFHKIRIAKGDEWKTAFRTRYGLFEWLVTPFGLANAPSTFQKYINWSLREYLDEFCSAYIDDVLIYTNGSIQQHRTHVTKVLRRLQEAGLQLDIDKCEFETKSTKYLGFIIEAGRGVRTDPEKVQAIKEWEPPKTVKGVRGFLGFANFYRKFIPRFSDIVRPLTALTRKDHKYEWTPETERAFQELKELFITAPILAPFDSTRETIVETDSSGWCVGGTLLQRGDDGFLHPCAYYSQKNSPAECNYEIYDKELLAVVRCLEEWDADLRSVEKFTIHSDHQSLEYFMTVRKLTERQLRWSLILSRYNFTIAHIPGRTNERADALSRREQDLPANAGDPRIQHRMVRLLRPEMLNPSLVVQSVYKTIDKTIKVATLAAATTDTKLQELVSRTAEESSLHRELTLCVQEERRVFPSNLGIKASISDCSLSESGKLLYRGRLWIPDSEPLRTRILQETHDSKIGGHPGRETMTKMLVRQCFWPNMLRDIRQFVRNCDTCRSN